MTEEQLNKLNIYELRTLARRTGVVSPTSKRKDELIREVIAINSGSKERHISKTKQGRPPKNFVGYGLINVFMPEEQNSLYPDRLPSAYMSLAQNQPKFTVGDVKSFIGYVEFLTSNSIILRPYDLTSRECVYVPIEIAERYNLRAGDLLEVEIEPASIDSPAICKDVFTINACPISKYSPDTRLEYFDIRHIKPTKVIEFNNQEYSFLKMKHGEMIFVYCNNNNETTITATEMLNSVKDGRKLYINPSIIEKNRVSLDGLENTEKFVSSIISDEQNTKRVLNLAINRIKRIVEKGDRVIVLIDDVKTISLVDDNLFLTKNLLSLTKEGGNSGSATIIALVPNNEKINLSLNKLCDKSYDLVDGKFIERK